MACQLQLSLLIDTDEIQDFSKEENFVSSEDTILSFTCEDITVVMATLVSANEIYKSYMPYCYNTQNTNKGYLFSTKIRMCIRSIFH